jgi:hypothetical protein
MPGAYVEPEQISNDDSEMKKMIADLEDKLVKITEKCEKTENDSKLRFERIEVFTRQIPTLNSSVSELRQLITQQELERKAGDHVLHKRID